MKKYVSLIISSLIFSTAASSEVFAGSKDDVTSLYESHTEGNRRLFDPSNKCEIIPSLSRDGIAIWSSDHNAFYAGRPGANDPSLPNNILDHGGVQIALKAENVREIVITMLNDLIELPSAAFSDVKTTYEITNRWKIFTPSVREEHDYEWQVLRSGRYVTDKFGPDFRIRTNYSGNQSEQIVFERNDMQPFDAYVHIQINVDAVSANRNIGFSPGVGNLYSDTINVACY